MKNRRVKRKEYALYKGDNLLAIGTLFQIARQLGVQKETIYYYTTQAYQNRLRRRKAEDGNVRSIICLD